MRGCGGSDLSKEGLNQFNHNFGIAGHCALITGGARGIGRATAELFARCGAHVGINYLTNEKDASSIVNAARALGVKAMAFPGNVADLLCAENVVEQAW